MPATYQNFIEELSSLWQVHGCMSKSAYYSFPWDMHLDGGLEPVGHTFEPQKDLGIK